MLPDGPLSSAVWDVRFADVCDPATLLCSARKKMKTLVTTTGRVSLTQRVEAGGLCRGGPGSVSDVRRTHLFRREEVAVGISGG